MKLTSKTKAVELTTITTSYNKRSEHSNYTNNPSKFKHKFDRNLLPNAESYYKSQFPNLKIINNQAQVRCPFHDDHTPSLSIKFPDGCFYCHGCKAKGTDVLDFQRQRYKQNFEEAVTELNAWEREIHMDKNRITMEQAKQAAVKYWEIKNLIDKGWIMILYPYQYADGSFCYVVVRLDPPAVSTEEKWIRPFYFNGKEWVLGKPKFPDKKPIYSLPKIASNSDDYVWVVEGERCADELISLGLIATTSGSANSAGNADWSPLRNKKAIIWPDKDPSGLKYAQEVTKILMSLNCSVQWIDINKLDLPPKGDCIDFLALNPDATAETIRNLPIIQPQIAESLSITETVSIGQNFKGDFFDDIIPLNNNNQPAIPYPIDCLPRDIKNAVIEYQGYGQQPISLVACSALSNISLVCQGLANISRDEQLISPLSLYFIVIAESGERKTAADNHFKKPAGSWEKIKREELRVAIKEYNALFNIWKCSKKKILDKIEKDNNLKQLPDLKQQLIELEKNEPQKVIVPALYNEETTTEALAYDLANGYQSSSLWSDEGGIIVGGHGMTQENVTKFTALLNRLWDGNDHRVNRRGSESFIIEGRRLTCSIMMQPVIFNQFVECCKSVSRENGFLARCLIVNPESTMGTRYYKEPPTHMPYTEVFNNRIYQLLNTELPLDEQLRLDPKILKLSPEAKDIWIKFHNEVETELPRDFFGIKDFAAKAADIAVRMAGVFHIFCDDPGNEVQLETIRNAIGIVAWHLYDIKKTMGVYAVSQELQNAKQLINWLINEKVHELNVAHILHFAPKNLRTKERRDDAITILVKHNYLQIEKRNGCDFIIINPKLYEDTNE